MTSVEDLRKALDNFPKNPMKRDVTFWVLEVDEWLETLKEKFSVFQADYDKQVHVSHEQLSDKIPTDQEIKDYIGVLGSQVNEAFILGFKSGWNAYNEKLKELLEAQTEKETNK